MLRNQQPNVEQARWRGRKEDTWKCKPRPLVNKQSNEKCNTKVYIKPALETVWKLSPTDIGEIFRSWLHKMVQAAAMDDNISTFILALYLHRCSMLVQATASTSIQPQNVFWAPLPAGQKQRKWRRRKREKINMIRLKKKKKKENPKPYSHLGGEKNRGGEVKEWESGGERP